MTYLERQNSLRELFQEKSSYSVKELAYKFNVSYNTIHTDINTLIDSGVPLSKIHGNIILRLEEKHSISNIQLRKDQNKAEKAEVARILVKNLPQKEFSSFFDASTTNLEIAKLLHLFPYRMTCITHSIEMALITGKNPQISTILTGGGWWDMEHVTIGNTTNQEMSNYHTDIAILGCSGISMEEGIFNACIETNSVKQIMAENAIEVWLVFEHSKWDRKILTYLFDFSEIDVIITNKKPSDEWLIFLEKKGIRVIYS